MRMWFIAGVVLLTSCLPGQALAQGMCGGLQGLQCPSNQFCDFAPEAQCGAADQTGTCRPKPDACTEQYDPVCGCDGQTYGNACHAAMAGVSVAQAGECGAPQTKKPKEAKKPKKLKGPKDPKDPKG